MGWVLATAVTVDGEVYGADTMPPPDVASRIGEHVRRYVGEGGSSVSGVVETEPAPIQIEDPNVEAEGITEVRPPADEFAFGPEPTEVVSPEPEANPTEVAPPEETELPADPEPTPEPLSVPNRGGKGSSRDHWVAYAESKGVEVTDDMERNEIIDACRSAGVPVD